jgi:hypothetical protein
MEIKEQMTATPSWSLSQLATRCLEIAGAYEEMLQPFEG